MGKIILTKLFSKNKQMEGTKYMEEPKAPASGADAAEQADSEAEEEMRDHKESQFQLTFHLDKLAGALTDGGKVVVCDPGTAQALVKIVFDTDLSEVGKVEVTAEGKTEDALTIHAAKGVVFVFVLPSMSASHCSQAIDAIYPLIAQKNCRPSHGTGNERQGGRLLQVHCWRAFHHNRELVGFHLNSEWTPWSGQRRHELDLGIQSFQASAQGDECKSSWYIQLSQFCYL